ncbi:capsular polysaccharide export protein, LipB/KpsS family [Pontiella desulfatans]|uniref:capsular polysaccharide export protein, LipB/KpsS family n=1 Tax=Pontiella desulfatans TaxID=2750659 RepID=UPI0014446F3B|nr:hypothetical protein [Pontiella desulfatans]
MFSSEKARARVLLLQGPPGAFFKKLQLFLEGKDHDVWRVVFNPADRFYSKKRGRINFYGDLGEWEKWFADFIDGAGIDHVILFGAERPAHRAARSIAAEKGIEVVALEEGYIRPGYITVERGGNNASSPLAGKLPPPEMKYEEQPDFPAEDFKGYRHMCFYNSVYYTLRAFFSVGKQKTMHHREVPLFLEILLWIRNFWRRVTKQSMNFSIIQNLLEHHDGNYYLVPLQVDSDSQLREAGLGWSSLKLISASLKSFARHATPGTRLVFKVHPLARGHVNHATFVPNMARAFGIEDRVDVVDAGSLGLLTRHSAGMLTINSTSGLSALYHGVPLLVAGSAFYAHPELAMGGDGDPDFNSFWRCRHVARKETRRAYLRWVKHEALVVGDFYAPHGVHAACQNIYLKLAERRRVEKAEVEVRNAC